MIWEPSAESIRRSHMSRYSALCHRRFQGNPIRHGVLPPVAEGTCNGTFVQLGIANPTRSALGYCRVPFSDGRSRDERSFGIKADLILWRVSAPVRLRACAACTVYDGMPLQNEERSSRGPEGADPIHR